MSCSSITEADRLPNKQQMNMWDRRVNTQSGQLSWGREMKYDSMYMDIAKRVAEESKCPRKQVGCVILTETGLLSPGFNGHAPGGPNEWEDKGTSNPEVVHAELNSLGKMLEQGVSAKGATVFVTMSPCLECAKLLVRGRVRRVVYMEEYGDIRGIDYLRRYGIVVNKMETEDTNE